MSEQSSFGRWLKRLRAAQDLTQERLTEAIGCAVPTIRSFEIGRRRPSREMAERIADVLKVPPVQREEFLRQARLTLPTEQPEITEPVDRPTVAASHVAPPELLIGRQAEINTLRRLLHHDQQRLVTILGPGGMGKTRLAQQVAADCGRHFRHGAAFVALAAVADGQNVPTTIADGLGLALQQAVDVPERVLHLLAEREQLVVLDNFEHLLLPTAASHGGAIDFLQQILQHCAGIHLLVTSRERLRIGSERTFELSGLATQAQSLEQSEAALLFVARAQQVDSQFMLNSNNREAVARICHLLDGMPLALELAASWVRVLTCAEIAEEIQRSIDFLVLADRDMTPRHRSMRVVFDHSWSLLRAEEQRVLARLSVFRGGCRREAAAAVAEAGLPVLAALIDKSLLRKTQIGATTRYDMHELIRQYAADQLGADPAAEAITHRRHGEYYLDLVAQRGEAITTAAGRAVMAELQAEIDNLRRAWDWAVTHQEGVRLNAIAQPIWFFFEVRALHREGEDLFRRAAQMAETRRHDPSLDRQVSDPFWAHMAVHQAYFIHRSMGTNEALQLLARAFVVLRQTEEPFILRQALFTQGVLNLQLGNHQAAFADFREGLAIANGLQSPFLVGFHQMFMGLVLHQMGEYAEAFQHLEQAIGYLRQVGEPRCLSQALSFAHETALALGRAAETAAGVEEALDLARRTDDQFSLVLALEQKALVQQAAGALDLAAQLLAEAYTRCSQLGDRWRQAHVLTLQAQLAWQGGDHLLARQLLVAAYQLAQRFSCHAHIPQTLVALAALLAEQGETVRAFTLAQLVRDDPYSTRPLRQRAGHLIDTLTPQVAAAEQAAISARLQNTPVERVVADVLTLA